MIILKYDTLAAIQCGYINYPHEALADLGYTKIASPKPCAIYRIPDMLFFEVERGAEPPLEKSQVLDGRFDRPDN